MKCLWKQITSRDIRTICYNPSVYGFVNIVREKVVQTQTSLRFEAEAGNQTFFLFIHLVQQTTG